MTALDAARRLAKFRDLASARAELADRRRLRFPPAVRVATLTGPAQSVDEALAVVDGELERRRGMDVLGPVQLDDDRVRSIIRFDYADGTVVAGALRAALVKLGSGRRGGPPAGPRRAAAKLTVRFDDPEPF